MLVYQKKHVCLLLLHKHPIYAFNDFPLFFSVFIDIHEYANYANMITCIFDHGMKDVF